MNNPAMLSLSKSMRLRIAAWVIELKTWRFPRPALPSGVCSRSAFRPGNRYSPNSPNKSVSGTGTGDGSYNLSPWCHRINGGLYCLALRRS